MDVLTTWSPCLEQGRRPQEQSSSLLTSKRAQSQDVFQCVGRCRCPNWIS